VPRLTLEEPSASPAHLLRASPSTFEDSGTVEEQARNEIPLGEGLTASYTPAFKEAFESWGAGKARLDESFLVRFGEGTFVGRELLSCSAISSQPPPPQEMQDAARPTRTCSNRTGVVQAVEPDRLAWTPTLRRQAVRPRPISLPWLLLRRGQPTQLRPRNPGLGKNFASQCGAVPSPRSQVLRRLLMPFATTDMPGHQLLKERVDAALNRAVETQSVDFKESAPWDALKWGIVRHAIGMGNLRGGGLIIVGVSGRDDVWELDGVMPEHLETFDVDVIADLFNKHISPAPRVEVLLHEREGKRFLVLDIDGLEDIPFVCRKSGPDGSKVEKAAFYHRPIGGRPRTEKVTSAEDMRPIFQVAAENGARAIEGLIQRLGGRAPDQAETPSDTSGYDLELGDL
jgi:hypothetical protein